MNMFQSVSKYFSLILFFLFFGQILKSNDGYDVEVAATETNKGELKKIYNYNRKDDSTFHFHRKRGTSLIASFLPSLIITGVGTSLTLSCGIYAPTLEKNRQLSKKLSISIKKKKHEINIEWNNVKSLNNYAERLNASLDMLEKQMDQLYTLEEDAILLIDPNIYNQINRGLKSIEIFPLKDYLNLKISAVQNLTLSFERFNYFHPSAPYRKKQSVLTSDLKSKKCPTLRTIDIDDTQKGNIKKTNNSDVDLSNVYKAATSEFHRYFAASFFGVLAAVKVLALKVYVHVRIPQMTTRQVKVWVQRNPRLLHDRNLKFRGINLKIDPSVKYLTRLDKNQPVFERRGRYRKNHAQAKKLIRNAKIRGSVITSAAMLVWQLNTLLSHIKRCQEKNRYVKEMVEQLQNVDHNLTVIARNITNIETKLKHMYNDLAKRLQDDSLTDFVNNAYQIAKTSSQTSKKMMNSKRNIEHFKIHIRVADFNSNFVDHVKVEEAIHKLAKGVKLVNEFIYCNTAELKIILTSITQCKNGKKKSVLTSIFVKKIEKFKKVCDFYENNEPPEVRINKILSKAMGKANQSDECIRNDIILQEVVCSNVKKGFSDSKNAKVTGLDIQDIVYMKNRCVNKNINFDFKSMVCRDKSHGKPLKEIVNTLKAYDQRIIESIYHSCNLTRFQKKVICSFKYEGKSLSIVKEELKNYDPRKIENVFNNCVNLLSGHQRAFICTVKAIRNINDPYHQVFEKLAEKFGYKAVENVLKQGCGS